jgi:DNA-binding NtrC family response regulator
MKSRILIVDDEQNLRLMLGQMLELAGHEVDAVASGEDAVARLRDRTVDVVFLDVRLPGIDGLATLTALRKAHPDLGVIMMSGHGTIETAVRAVRQGAVDFLEKPLSRDQVLITLDQVLELKRLQAENRRLRAVVGEGELIGDSAPMEDLKARLSQVAPTEATVLILGESGSGKELVARQIHRESRRSGAAFLALNCAAIPGELIESELFGHMRGAFTGAVSDRAGVFETADGGTLFLDEIGDMPLPSQAKLLRVLETGEFVPVGATKSRRSDVRVVAATHRDLEARAAEGSFRQDLLHRLNVVPMVVPPLRERLEDVPGLARAFLEQAIARQSLPPRRFGAEALQALGRHPWPGNVRELRNLVERLAILASGETIGADFVESELTGDGERAAGPGPTLRSIVEQCEREAITRAVRGSAGNVAEAARRLGLERAHLYKKARALSLNLREL